MAKRFKQLSSVGRSYREQGQIYFTCQNYARLGARQREKIDRLCEQVGGEYAGALKEYLTTDADWQYICTRYYVSSGTLDRLRKRFYEAW